MALELLDAEVRHILEEQEQRARDILSANARVFEALATALRSQETIQDPELGQVLSAVAPYVDERTTARPAPWGPPA